MSKFIIICCFTFLALIFLPPCSIAQDGVALTHADVMPYFPGCNDFEGNPDGKRKCSNYNLVGFISTTLKYPEEAKKETLEGTVIVSFIINKDGYIQDAFILKDIGGGCGEEALAVVEKMPRWEAGMHKGKKVNVKLNLPIKFNFSGDGVSSKYRVLWGDLKGKTLSKKEIKENLLESISVRGPYGETIPVTEVIIAYERKNRFLDAIGQGRINVNQKKLLKRARRKGIITISATIQQEGKFVEVDREFEIVKNKKKKDIVGSLE